MDDALKPLSHGFDADAWVPDSRARWAGRVAGWLLLLLGATGALGLLPGLQFLKQPVTGFSPLSLVTGLSLCALGAGLVALVSGKRTAGAVGAAGAVLVGALAVTQYLVGVDLGINPVAGGGAATSGLSSSVRVSIASAMLLGLAGAGLLTLASPISPHRGRLFAGGFGCVVVAFALGILLTTGIWNLEQQAGLLAGSSIQTLIGSLIGGSCLVFIAWSADPAAARSAYWLPVSVGGGMPRHRDLPLARAHHLRRRSGPRPGDDRGADREARDLRPGPDRHPAPRAASHGSARLPGPSRSTGRTAWWRSLAISTGSSQSPGPIRPRRSPT